MNARDLKSLYALLAPYLPGLVGHKRLLLMPPLNGMLRAIYLDPSSLDKSSFYPSWLVMPLCDPTDHLSLLLSKCFFHETEGYDLTIRKPHLIEDLVNAIRAEGLPALRQAETLDGFLKLATPARGNPHTPKQAAFVLARAGENDRAIALIDDYLPKLGLDSHWEKDIDDISVELRDLLMHDPEAADRRLREWEDYTIRNLKLEAFR